jgi:LysR family transcriptional activator of mexEF-oprN operon
MNNISENDLRRLDFNLLLVLHVLLEEGNVTRTAERLYLGQPAISGALARLRAAFSDPLFVRTPKGMQPTPRALALGERMRPFLALLQDELRGPPVFDPAVSGRVFHLGMSDALEAALLPALLQHLLAVAPGVRIVAHQTDSGRAPAMLDGGDVELAVGVFDPPAAWHGQRRLFEWHFVCLYDPARIDVGADQVALETYLAYPHLLTSFNGELTGFIDELLAASGHLRRVQFSSRNFSTSAVMLTKMAAFTTLPSYYAEAWRDALGLAIAELPFEVPRFHVSLMWAVSQERDPGLAWLRNTTVALWEKQSQGEVGQN